MYKAKLSAFIKWQITDSRIKQHELDLYKKADAANKKILIIIIIIIIPIEKHMQSKTMILYPSCY